MTTVLIVIYALIGVTVASLTWNFAPPAERKRSAKSLVSWAIIFTIDLLFWPVVLAVSVGAVAARYIRESDA